jgi:hypothetical protein
MQGTFFSFLAKTQKLPTKRIAGREPKNRSVDSSGLLLHPIIITSPHLLPPTEYIGINPPAPSIQQQLVSKDVGESRRAALKGEETIRWQNLASVF